MGIREGMRSAFVLAICLSAALVVRLVQADSVHATSPNLKIGAILPLSGGASNFGAIARRGIEMALGEMSPEDRARISVIYEDDGLSNARSATAARKLLSIDKVDALLTWSSGTGLTVASLVEAKRVPHLSIASDPAVAKGRRYSFTYWPIPDDEVRVVHDYLASSGIKRVALVSQVHNGIFAIRDAFVDQAKQRGGITIVANEEVSGEVSDFRAVLERVKAKGDFDALIPIFFPGQLAVCIKQARGLGISAQLVGFETFEDKDEIRAAGGLMSGAVYATGGDPQPDFVKRYQARYTGESYYTANQAYDIIRLFADASRAAKDGDSMVAFLRSLKSHPTTSGEVSVNDQNQFRLPSTLKKIDANGVPRVL